MRGVHRSRRPPRPLLLAGLLGAGVTLLAGGGLVAAHYTASTKDSAVSVANSASQQAQRGVQSTLYYCGLGDNFAKELRDHGLCAVAESVHNDPSVANPQALINAPQAGPEGKPGRDGRDGENGVDGQPGKDGKDGSPATSMTLRGSGTVYTCRRAGGANTSPVYDCPGLGGVQPGLGGMPPGLGAPVFPGPGRSFPRPPSRGGGHHPSPPVDVPVPDTAEPTP